MATTLSQLTCSMQLTAFLANTIQGTTVKHNNNVMDFSLALTAGTTANKANVFYTETDRVKASGNDDLDFFDLAVLDQTTDILGNTITFTEIVALIIRNQSTSAGDALCGGIGATTAWNSMFNGDDDALLILQPGAFFMITAPEDPGFLVADTSNHLFRVAASGGSITYDIGILGRNA